MSQLPPWLSRAVKAQVITRPQALELASLQEKAPKDAYIDVPEHLHEATSRLWLWEVLPVNQLPV